MDVPAAPNNSTIIIGLGNEYLSDDGIGILAVRALAQRLPHDDFTFVELSIGGLGLLEHLAGFRRCVILDAIAGGEAPPGHIHRFDCRPDESVGIISSSHQLDLGQVLTLGRLLGADLPERVTVYGIEAGDVTTFRTEPTPPVAASLPELLDMVSDDLTTALMATKTHEIRS